MAMFGIIKTDIFLKDGIIMQVNNIQQNAVYGVQLRPETANKRNEIVPEEEKEIPRKRDEYIPSEEDEPIGLYKLSEDEEGNPMIEYDKAEDGNSPKKADGDNSKETSSTTTCNTDKVDEEIKRLKEKQEQLEQKLRSAEGENARRLEQQLKSVSAELAQKDNDTYRRQNAVFYWSVFLKKMPFPQICKYI